MRVVFTGGGTGGHVIPLIPMIEALRTIFLARREGIGAAFAPGELELFFAGPLTAAIREIGERYDVRVTAVPSGKVRRYASWGTALDLGVWLPLGLAIALVKLWWIMPDVVVSKGGFGSLPTVLAAAWYRIPLIVHESDVAPGLVTRLAAPWASAITLGFLSRRAILPRYAFKLILTGTPVRRSFYEVTRTDARARWQIAASERVLVVMGGSQGARQINEVLLKVLPRLVVDYTVIHIAGRSQEPALRVLTSDLLEASSRDSAYRLYGHVTDALPSLLAAADVVVARAGATTIAELAALKKATILIPLSGAASDHQRKNATELEAAGAAVVLDPLNVQPHLFERAVRRLLDDVALSQSLGQAMGAFDHPQAATEIAALTIRLAQGLAPVRHTPGPHP